MPEPRRVHTLFTTMPGGSIRIVELAYPVCYMDRGARPQRGAGRIEILVEPRRPSERLASFDFRTLLERHGDCVSFKYFQSLLFEISDSFSAARCGVTMRFDYTSGSIAAPVVPVRFIGQLQGEDLRFGIGLTLPRATDTPTITSPQSPPVDIEVALAGLVWIEDLLEGVQRYRSETAGVTQFIDRLWQHLEADPRIASARIELPGERDPV